MSSMKGVPGCDHYDGRHFCERKDVLYVDEVTELRFCAEHAGPLAWSVCKVNAYTIAVRVSGHLDVPVPDRWHEEEKAA